MAWPLQTLRQRIAAWHGNRFSRLASYAPLNGKACKLATICSSSNVGQSPRMFFENMWRGSDSSDFIRSKFWTQSVDPMEDPSPQQGERHQHTSGRQHGRQASSHGLPWLENRRNDVENNGFPLRKTTGLFTERRHLGIIPSHFELFLNLSQAMLFVDLICGLTMPELMHTICSQGTHTRIKDFGQFCEVRQVITWKQLPFRTQQALFQVSPCFTGACFWKSSSALWQLKITKDTKSV